MKFAFILSGDTIIDIVAKDNNTSEIHSPSESEIQDILNKLPLDLQEDFEERAALMDETFYGSLPRDKAEMAALRIILKRKQNLN